MITILIFLSEQVYVTYFKYFCVKTKKILFVHPKQSIGTSTIYKLMLLKKKNVFFSL